MITYSERREKCPHLVTPEAERRPANALNVECGTPSERCRLKPPPHWRGPASVMRWLASGGSPLVLGECNQNCPDERGDLLSAPYGALAESHHALKLACTEIAELTDREAFVHSLNSTIGRAYAALKTVEASNA